MANSSSEDTGIGEFIYQATRTIWVGPDFDSFETSTLVELCFEEKSKDMPSVLVGGFTCPECPCGGNKYVLYDMDGAIQFATRDEIEQIEKVKPKFFSNKRDCGNPHE